jgi:hypothetical protein
MLETFKIPKGNHYIQVVDDHSNTSKVHILSEGAGQAMVRALNYHTTLHGDYEARATHLAFESLGHVNKDEFIDI